MTYDARQRDRYRLAVTAVTGVTACAVAAGTGAATGLAEFRTAQQSAGAQVEGQAAVGAAKARRPRVITRQRPVRTKVVTRVVRVTVGGGEVTPDTSTSTSTSSSSPPGSSSSDSSGNSGSNGSSGPGPAAPPPPPPPPPQSSGS